MASGGGDGWRNCAEGGRRCALRRRSQKKSAAASSSAPPTPPTTPPTIAPVLLFFEELVAGAAVPVDVLEALEEELMDEADVAELEEGEVLEVLEPGAVTSDVFCAAYAFATVRFHMLSEDSMAR